VKSAIIFMGLPLYVIWIFSFMAFNIYSLFSVWIILTIICYGVVPINIFFGELEASCTG
jgi:hypothetical protein